MNNEQVISQILSKSGKIQAEKMDEFMKSGTNSTLSILYELVRAHD